MLKLIHGADFHLDSPFSGLSPQQAARRRAEQRLLLERLAQTAAEQQADLVLLSGDLLDGGRIYRETAQELARALGSIPCPVFIAPGNHDPFTAGSPYATLQWPENVHIFHSGTMEAVDLPHLNCTVYGRAFTSPHESESPLQNFCAAPADGRLLLGCLHGDVSPSSDYAPLSPEEIAASGLDYLALGHIHRCSGLQREGSTFWAYPGCPEGRGFDETGEKGVLFAEVEKGAARTRFIPLARRRYGLLTVDVTGQEPLEAILSTLPEDTTQDIFRILLTGECAAPDLTALELALSPRFYALSLRDNTRLPRDLWARREEDTLTGLFLRTMWAHCQADPDDPVLQLAVRYGLAALEGGEEVRP